MSTDRISLEHQLGGQKSELQNSNEDQKGGEGCENVCEISVAIDQPKLGGSQLSISIFALSAAMPVFPIIYWQLGDYQMVCFVGGDQWSLWILSSNID